MGILIAVVGCSWGDCQELRTMGHEAVLLALHNPCHPTSAFCVLCSAG